MIQRQCKASSMQSPLYIRSLASSGTTHEEGGGKGGIFKKITASLGHAAAPIGVLAAICSVAVLIGAHTATQHFFRSPSVHVTKRNRGSMPEVDQPDVSIRSGDNLINKSFLRKVGHLQDKQYGDETVANIYTRSRESDTLQTVGVIDKK
ncbi:hypothetical protein C2S51_038496 [Perilla frutescens var. frutescens]|nr:hypothetical protein C2S51_038496 [Perilla frutescens var. frutescens]